MCRSGANCAVAKKAEAHLVHDDTDGCKLVGRNVVAIQHC